MPHSPDHPSSRSLAPPQQTHLHRWHKAQHARTAGATDLAHMLCDSRTRTLSLLDAYLAALGPELTVPYNVQINPPLWEMGHVGWFQEFWLARNPQRLLGTQADPLCPRLDPWLPEADTLYNSSQVAHPRRWHLPLPDLQVTRAYLAATLQTTLTLLAQCPQDDAALYFYRLALFHEDMHSEAATYMAKTLGIDLPASLRPVQPQPTPLRTLSLTAGTWRLGQIGQVGHDNQAATDPLPAGFAFDNELPHHTVAVPACEIDNQVVSWRRYLPFVAEGCYQRAQFWDSAGWQWLQSHPTPGLTHTCPRHLRPSLDTPGQWEACVFGHWQALDLDSPACHLTHFEAQAWCRWAGRQLPLEAQWEQAAITLPHFEWGQVWEWTRSPFAPHPGFVAHPYRDYSAPWFDGRPVLRGASGATSPRMAHPCYRNFFTAERNDIHAGFRSCAL